MISNIIVDAFLNNVYKLFLLFDAIVYSFINWVYQIILILAQGNIFSNSTQIDQLISRIYVIVGVVVLFLVAYTLLKNMVNPDEALKSKTSPVKLIANVLISIFLIAVIPQIFQFAMNFQDAILRQNTIGKLILGGGENVATDPNSLISEGGIVMSETVFKGFFGPNFENDEKFLCPGDASLKALMEEQTGETCEEVMVNDTTYSEWWGKIRTTNNFFHILEASDEIVSKEISYKPFISTVVGAFVLYVLVVYCVQIAIRMVKFAVYELIAPLPILARILPQEQGGKVFNNWLKATVSTFVEIFVRLAILFFAIFMINLIMSNFLSIFSTTSETWGRANFLLILIAQVFVVVGIVLFVKDFPKILKDITGLDGGKYGKDLIKGLGVMTSSIGGGATAALRTVAQDLDKDDMSAGRKARRALTAGLTAGTKGLFNGGKVENLRDIPRMAGKSASRTLDNRSAREAAGGFFPYYTQRINDTIERGRNWVGGTSDELKALKGVNDSILAQIKAIKAVAEDYIGKHEYEYKFFADESLQAQYTALNEKMAAAMQISDRNVRETQMNLVRSETEAFLAKNAADVLQLDILREMSEDRRIPAEERAEHARTYQKYLKLAVDSFSTTVKGHEGAEKEAAQVAATVKTIGELIKENRSATAVQYAITGLGNEKHADIKTGFTEDMLESDTAAFIKNLKKATEYADIDISAQLNEAKRREERIKAASGKKE